MCVDFTDLNKACPKDSFPLPRIDQLVDSTTGHKLLSSWTHFLDTTRFLWMKAIKRNLIRYQPRVTLLQSYALWTEERRSHLPKIGELYVLSPFGRNVEVYVDNLLVKSKDEANHFDDLKNTFSR